MKQFLTAGWVFAPGQRTLDFTTLDGFDARRLLGVINLDDGVLVYAPSVDGRGYDSLAGSVLTLAFDTSGMGANDRLMVIYDRDADLDPAWNGTAQRASVGAILRAIWGKLAGTLKVSADSLPLPAGAATAAGQDAAGTMLGNILTALGALLKVKVQVGGSDVAAANPLPVQERPVQGAVAITTRDADVTPGRLFYVNCTIAGTVQVILADGSQIAVPLRRGPAFLSLAVRQVVSAGTTAEATFANLI